MATAKGIENIFYQFRKKSIDYNASEMKQIIVILLKH